ncbi:uncharacterized protein LOC110840611 [Zootermopsis nevadensis]|uniref:uncharacterized protein LOC110840611 n=1 Tax=Zootermopsis nevadensis TaxID=136037 RepID=UPI000B8E90CD|nr:uncharacterized protein LOC110840611 [Zootermopsis nevadensis]
MYEFISFLLLLLLHWLYRRISFNKSKSNEVGVCSQQEQEPSGLHITDLPPEVLALIFERCPYEVLARRVRLVCKRFCDVTTLVLNCGFLTLGPKIDRAMVNAGSRFKEGRTVEELLVIFHPFSSDMVDDLYRTGQSRTTEQQLLMDQHYIALMLMKFEYRALRAVAWRHIHRPYSDSGHLACFYSGSLLDEFLRFLRVARHSPMFVGLSMLNPDNGNEVITLCIQCSKFMKHFRKRTETFERDYSISGAKIIDLCYDLLKKHERMTSHEQAVTVNGTECHIEADYR